LDDIDYLLRLVRQRPDWFLDELLHLLETNRFICVNYVTIHRTLVRAGASWKKLKIIALERNEDGQNAFIQHMAQYDPDELGFIDETSKNEKTAARSHGRARKGQRAEMRQHFVRGRRLTATSLLTVEGITTSRVIEGSMTKSLYLEFLEQEVVCMIHSRFFIHLPPIGIQMPLCTAYPGPLSVLVMDNARIHHGDEILELADRFSGFFLLFNMVDSVLKIFRCPYRVPSTILA